MEQLCELIELNQKFEIHFTDFIEHFSEEFDLYSVDENNRNRIHFAAHKGHFGPA